MQSALQTINAHYTAIMEKQIEEITNKYFPTEDTYVVLEGPRLTTKGFTKIKEGWEAFCKSPINLTSIQWTEGPFIEEHNTMAWVAGILLLKINIKETTFENTFRASFVLVKQEQDYLIKHEHVSVVHTNPYGIGDWKK
jgi:ketosteroid isomerase-like protein